MWGPTALSRGQMGPALSPCLFIFFAGPRGDSEGRCMRMCVRRRWRVGWVRRAVGSSARSARLWCRAFGLSAEVPGTPMRVGVAGGVGWNRIASASRRCLGAWVGWRGA